MNIALDWDQTYTRDPAAWQAFIILFRSHGHRIWIVTARSERTPVGPIPSHVEGVIYCDMEAKKSVTDRHDIEIHVWIDDEPIFIHKGADSLPILFAKTDTEDDAFLISRAPSNSESNPMSVYELEIDIRTALAREGLRAGPTSRAGHEKLKAAGPEAVRKIRDDLQKQIEFLNQYA